MLRTDDCGLPDLLEGGERDEGVGMDRTWLFGDVAVARAAATLSMAACEGAGYVFPVGFPRFLPCAMPRYISYCFTAKGSSGKGYSAPNRSAAAMPALHRTDTHSCRVGIVQLE